MSRLTSTVRSRSPSVTSSGRAGARSSVTGGRCGARRCRPGRRRGTRALMSVGAGSKRIGRATSSTSLTRLLRRSISSSMSLAASRDVGGGGAVARQRPQRALDDHQRVADFVRDHRGQPAERRQPLALRRLALEAHDRVGQRVERRRQHVRIVVVPAALSLGGGSCASGRRSRRSAACDR